MRSRTLGWLAESVVFVLVYVSLWLFGLGAFCFESSFLSLSLHDRIAVSPDCFLVSLSNRVNPKLWLVGNLSFSLILSLIAQVVAVGFFKSKPWAWGTSLLGSLAAIAFFWQLGASHSEFKGFAQVCQFLFVAIAAISLYASLRGRPAP